MTITVVDKSSRLPYYDQLRAILEGLIRAGSLAVGAQLPSEAQLCDEHGVSRTVVRQALNELAAEGLITRVKGKGSFVAAPKVDEHLAQSLTGLAEEVRARGQHLTNRILTFEEQLPPGYVARLLRLLPGETVVHLERLRLVNREPWVVTSTFLPYRLCGRLLGFDMRRRSLYGTLERDLGIVLSHGNRTIEAEAAGKELAGLLGMREHAPVLLLRSIAYDAAGTPIEYFLAWHRGDRSRFDIQLRREPASAPEAYVDLADPAGVDGNGSHEAAP